MRLAAITAPLAKRPNKQDRAEVLARQHSYAELDDTFIRQAA
jgi:hypothetical protein